MALTQTFLVSIIFVLLRSSADASLVKRNPLQKRELPPIGEVVVYTDENYEGTSEHYDLPKWVCVNVDPSFVGYISSIYPAKGTCVNVFRNRGCPSSERPLKLKEHDYGTDVLAKIHLNDQISSLKLC